MRCQGIKWAAMQDYQANMLNDTWVKAYLVPVEGQEESQAVLKEHLDSGIQQ